MTIRVSARAVFRVLASIVFALIIAHILSQSAIRYLPLRWAAGELLSRLDLEQEISVPTWFSQSILLLAAAILALIASQSRIRKESDRNHWTGLALIFLYLSIDEGASLHEIAVLPMRRMLGIHNSFLVLSWIIPAAILVIVFVIVYLRFWWRLPRPIRFRFAVAGATYVGGALIVEAFSSAFVARYGMDHFGLILMRVWEEGMEMAGVCMFIDALLLHAGQIMPAVQVRLSR
ncbi:MAG TPA: hypothetical protein VN181_05455 [Thermoanaerobaculia bacterium]|nr:hypothetical protein [Thermoanaerobaculia bacterium]